MEAAPLEVASAAPSSVPWWGGGGLWGGAGGEGCAGAAHQNPLVVGVEAAGNRKQCSTPRVKRAISVPVCTDRFQSARSHFARRSRRGSIPRWRTTFCCRRHLISWSCARARSLHLCWQWMLVERLLAANTRTHSHAPAMRVVLPSNASAWTALKAGALQHVFVNDTPTMRVPVRTISAMERRAQDTVRRCMQPCQEHTCRVYCAFPNWNVNHDTQWCRTAPSAELHGP